MSNGPLKKKPAVSRGDIIRGAGGYLNRNNKPGVGIGHPTGGDEGEVRVQMVNNTPRLYAKAGDQWYGINLSDSTDGSGAADEFIVGGSSDYIKINTEDGLTIVNSNTDVAKIGKTLRIGVDSATSTAVLALSTTVSRVA